MAGAIGSFPGLGPPPTFVLDLGAGGGVPGLVLAELWATARFVLLDANHRRTDFLEEAVCELGWADRVTVVCQRAEEAGRDPSLRGRFDLVVARGFGPPATTAECAAPFLSVGGHLAVSEPPAAEQSGDRWPAVGCAQFGLEPLALATGGPISVKVLLQVQQCPDRFPRRNGLPAKRPLFEPDPRLGNVPRGT